MGSNRQTLAAMILLFLSLLATDSNAWADNRCIDNSVSDVVARAHLESSFPIERYYRNVDVRISPSGELQFSTQSRAFILWRQHTPPHISDAEFAFRYLSRDEIIEWMSRKTLKEAHKNGVKPRERNAVASERKFKDEEFSQFRFELITGKVSSQWFGPSPFRRLENGTQVPDAILRQALGASTVDELLSRRKAARSSSELEEMRYLIVRWKDQADFLVLPRNITLISHEGLAQILRLYYPGTEVEQGGFMIVRFSSEDPAQAQMIEISDDAALKRSKSGSRTRPEHILQLLERSFHLRGTEKISTRWYNMNGVSPMRATGTLQELQAKFLSPPSEN